MPPAAPSAGSRTLNPPAVRKGSARPSEPDANSEIAAQTQTDSNPERRSGRFMSSLKRLFGPVKEKTEIAENSIAKATAAGRPADSRLQTAAVPDSKDDRTAKPPGSVNIKQGQSTVGVSPPDSLAGRPAASSSTARAPAGRSVVAGTSQVIDSKVEQSALEWKQQLPVAARGPEGGAIFEASRNANEQAPLDANARTPISGSANFGLPKVTVSGVSPLKVDLESDKPLSYRSFRLHNPERYVVDIQTGADLRNVSVPALEPNGLLQAVRVGSPENDKGLSRLVLDLSTADVDVSDSTDDSKRILSLLVGKPPIQAQLGKAPAGQTVVLDAGHGGSDPGAQRGDIQEKEITLQIAARVKKLLETGGVKVVMTRGEDTAVTLEDRVVLTNNVQPDAFLSVHINSLETNSTIHGIETYYQTDQSRPLAQLIHAQLVGKLEAPDRNIRKARFYVINHTPVPAVLAEVGFISNKEERTKLISTDYQNQVANALAQGVILYLSQRNDLAAAGTAKGATGTPRSGLESQDSVNRPVASLAQSGAAAPKTAR
jgi:N-acetylmuramoyl-L-alanine amidase